MITRQQFEQLMPALQLQQVQQLGILVEECWLSGNRFYLYKLPTFYVELLHELANLQTGSLQVCRIFDAAMEIV